MSLRDYDAEIDNEDPYAFADPDADRPEIVAPRLVAAGVIRNRDTTVTVRDRDGTWRTLTAEEYATLSPCPVHLWRMP